MSSTTRLNVYLSEPKGDEPSIIVPETGINSRDFMTAGMVVSGFLLTLLVAFLIFERVFKKKAQKNNKKQFKLQEKYPIFQKVKVALPVFAILSACAFAWFGSRVIFADSNDLELAIQSSPELNIEADILGTDEVSYIKDTVTIMQDSNYGYTLYLNVDNTNLVHNEDPSSVIPSLSQAGPLQNNTFGYSLTDPGESAATAEWNPVHLENERDVLVEVANTEAPVHAGDTIDVYYAVRSSDLKAGVYSTNLIYTAVSHMELKMQEMTTEVCNMLKPGIRYQFEDTRDGKFYAVSKLDDGNCWMTSDLALELEEGVALTSEDTDLNSKTEWSPNRTTETYGPEGEDWYCYDEAACETTRSLMYEHEGEPHYYYNYYTAAANSVSYGDGAYDNLATAPDSICPKGWSLPDRRQYKNLISAYRADNFADVLMNAPIQFGVNGIVSGSNNTWTQQPDFVGYDGYYWGSQLSSNYATIFRINEWDAWETDNNAYQGASVRCVANLTMADIVYHANTSDSVLNMPSKERFTPNRNKEIVGTISDKKPTRSGYQFAGWAVSEEGKQSYNSGDEVVLKDSVLNLYAVWYKETSLTLQDVTQEYCANNIEIGKQYLFKDTRDNKEYSVSKYEDGNCWMSSNLDLDLTDGVPLSPDDTDIAEEWTPNITTQTEDGARWEYDESCIDNENCPTYSYTTDNDKDGNFYNVFAAYAGDVTLNEETNRFESGESSICPRGWFLAGDDNFGNLAKRYGLDLVEYEDDTSKPYNAIPFFTDSFVGFYDGLGYFHYEDRSKEPREPGETGFLKKVFDVDISLYQSLPTGYGFAFNEGEPYYVLGSGEQIDLTEDATALGLSGLSVRCITRFNQIDVTYSPETTDSVSDFPQNGTVESLDRYGKIKISDSKPKRDGYIFAGWSTEASTKLKYFPGEEFTTLSPKVVFRANWLKETDVQYMQDMETGNCSNLEAGVQYGLRDKRDEKLYSVAKLDDGQCWMTSDLALDLDKNVALTEDTTDLNNDPLSSSRSSWTPSRSTETLDGEEWEGCWGEEGCDQDNRSLKYGGSYYYSWYTATAGTGKYNATNTNATDSICPKGWHLPSKNTYWVLLDMFESANPDLSVPPFLMNYNGHREDWSVYGQGRKLGYWSATAAAWNSAAFALDGYKSENGRVRNVVDARSVEKDLNERSVLNPRGDIDYDLYKTYGLGVRCVANADFSSMITFDKNTEDEVSDLPVTQQFGGRHGIAYVTIPAEVPKREGYTFLGWSKTEYYDEWSGNKLYQPGEVCEIDSVKASLYAIWQIDN